MNSSAVREFLTGVAVLTTSLFEFFAVAAVVNSIRQGWIEGPFDLAWIGGMALASPLVVLYALYVTRRSPVSGGLLAVCGAIPMGAIFYWFPPFWGLAFLVAAIAVTRAQRFAMAQ